MIPVFRMYASDADADNAVKKLKDAGFPQRSICVVKPDDAGDPGKAVAEAIKAKRVPSFYRRVATQGLKDGRSLVTIFAQFGEGQAAQIVMDEAGPVDTANLPEWPTSDNRTVSGMFGIPLLSENQYSTVSRSTGLSNFQYVFESFLGMGLLLKKAAPLSEAVGMSAVQERPKDWQKSMGMGLLSDNPAPLSSAIGLRTVNPQRKRKA